MQMRNRILFAPAADRETTFCTVRMPRRLPTGRIILTLQDMRRSSYGSQALLIRLRIRPDIREQITS